MKILFKPLLFLLIVGALGCHDKTITGPATIYLNNGSEVDCPGGILFDSVNSKLYCFINSDNKIIFTWDDKVIKGYLLKSH